MDPLMKGGGRITKPMGKVELFMETEIFMKVSGKTIKLMGMGYTRNKME